MEMNIFFEKLTNTLLQKFLNETEKINAKIDRLERKIEERGIQIEEGFDILSVQLAPIFEEFRRKTNSVSNTQSEPKIEIDNVEIDVNSLKMNDVSLDYINSRLEYKLVTQFGPLHESIFVMAVKLNGRMFYGLDSSKKKAKNNAAQNVLQFIKDELKEISVNSNRNNGLVISELKTKTCNDVTKKVLKSDLLCSEIKNNSQIGGKNKKLAKEAPAVEPVAPFTSASKTEIFSDFPEICRKLVEDKLNSLLINDPQHSKNKVIAGIIMTRNGTPEVISVAAGTRCIPGQNLSSCGDVINDMHAEILARRCLISYFYDQIELLINKQNSIFISDGKTVNKLKDGIEFHLYINTTPCGDAREFNPSTENTNPKSKKGLLRAKIEAGEGTHPTKKLNFTVQTFEMIFEGERLRTMSCSDKICKWNVLGLQGALLSNFIEPIYLKSVILGNVIHESHLQRALHDRIKDTLKDLPPSYHLNNPSMFFLNSTDSKISSGRSYAIAWSCGDQNYEVLIAKTGQKGIEISKFSKRNFLKRFTNIVEKLLVLSDVHQKINHYVVYSNLKSIAINYQKAKNSFNEAFIDAELGKWISKPREQDMFSLMN